MTAASDGLSLPGSGANSESRAPAGAMAAVATLLNEWRSMALKAADRHSSACDLFERRDGGYGVASTVLTAIVGSTIFVTLEKTTLTGLRILVGLVGITAAIASGVQTAAKYGQRAERHRQASRHYAAVARQIDELLASPPSAGAIRGTLDGLRKSLDDTGAMAPNVPPRIWKDRHDDQPEFRSHHGVVAGADDERGRPGANS